MGIWIVILGKTASKKIGALTRSMKFLSSEVALYLNKSTIRLCMVYYCHVCTGAPGSHLDMLDIQQKRVCRTVGATLTASLESLAHHRNVTSLSLFYRYYLGRCSTELLELVLRPSKSNHWGYPIKKLFLKFLKNHRRAPLPKSF